MKKLFWVLLLLGASPLTHAQTSPASVLVGHAPATPDDDTLLIELTDTPEASWRRLAQLLVQRGYSLEHTDATLLALATYPLGVDGTVVRVGAMIIDRTLVLHTYWATENSRQPHVRGRRRGGNNTEWRELEAIGRQLGGTVRYAAATAPQ